MMTEEGKIVMAVISITCSILGIFVFSLLLEPFAVITGIFGLASKKMPVKIVGLIGMLIGIIMFAYTVAMMLKVADALK